MLILTPAFLTLIKRTPNTSMTLKYLFWLITLKVSIMTVLMVKEDKGTKMLSNLFGQTKRIRKKVKKDGKRRK
jgi:hypothetical protein